MKFRKGFTLIEVIISIVVMAIAAAALLKIFGTAFTGSAVPVGQVSRQYQMIQSMEAITSQYRKELDAGTLTANWDTFKSSCTGNCTCTPASTIGTYTTQTEHLQVTCTDGEQTLFAIFTK
jgi:prepilin-type N-terminal cleavage/methylation domain-containing protein